MPFGAAAFIQSRRELQPIFLPVSPLLSRFGCYFRPSLALSVHPSPTPVHPQVIHAPVSHPRLAESTFTIPRPIDPATQRPGAFTSDSNCNIKHTRPSIAGAQRRQSAPLPKCPDCTARRPTALGHFCTAYHRVATPLPLARFLLDDDAQSSIISDQANLRWLARLGILDD